MAGPGKRILGHDPAEDVGPQNGPVGLRGLDGGDKESFTRGPSNRKAQTAPPAPAPAKKPYFLENIPPLLDKWGYPLAGGCMGFWQSGKEFQKSDTVPFKHRTRILDHDHLKGWTRTSKYPLAGLQRDLPWFSEEPKTGRKADVIRNIQAAFNKLPPGSVSLIFPDPIAASAPALDKKSPAGVPFRLPTTNDQAWADAVDAFGLFHDPSHSDGAGFGTAFKGGLGVTNWKDDYFLALGHYDWRYIPKGAAILFPKNSGQPSRLQVTINQVGIYAFDSYDFNSDQDLGFWDVDKEDVSIRRFGPLSNKIPSDQLYKPNLGYVDVDNASFRDYRGVVHNGLDFLIYSDVKFFDVKQTTFMFDLQSGKPVH
jgi:hypothetical protein